MYLIENSGKSLFPIPKERVRELLKNKTTDTAFAISVEINTNFSLDKEKDVYCRINYGDWVQHHGYNIKKESLSEREFKEIPAKWKEVYTQNNKAAKANQNIANKLI